MGAMMRVHELQREQEASKKRESDYQDVLKRIGDLETKYSSFNPNTQQQAQTVRGPRRSRSRHAGMKIEGEGSSRRTTRRMNRGM